MSGPTVRINDFNSYPEVTAVADAGSTLEIGNLNDFDMGMLGNQRKMSSTPPRAQSPALGELREVSDGIEFVNLDDTNVTYNVKPPPSGDAIRIVRDEAPFALRSSEPTLVLNSGNTAPPPAAPAPS